MTFTSISLAFDANAQALLNQQISVRVENQSLSNVLKNIEKQANVRFAFRPKEVPTKQKITLFAEREPLRNRFKIGL
jgi:hypothetical protein